MNFGGHNSVHNSITVRISNLHLRAVENHWRVWGYAEGDVADASRY